MKNTPAEIEKMRADVLISHLTVPSSVKLHLRVEFKMPDRGVFPAGECQKMMFVRFYLLKKGTF